MTTRLRTTSERTESAFAAAETPGELLDEVGCRWLGA
jgi:hypothetical protein